MKKLLPILVMMLIATTAFNQTSRRTANSSQSGTTDNHSTRSSSTQSTNNNRDSRSSNTNATTQSDRTHSGNDQHSSSSGSTRSNSGTNNTSSHSSGSNRATVNRNSDYRYRSETSTNTYHTSPRARVEYKSPRMYHEHHQPVHVYHEAPRSKVYRSSYIVYRAPMNYSVVWTPTMRRTYVEIYPMVRTWHYYDGYRIPSISAYDAEYYMGEVMTVYGRISEVFYSRATDEYFLYIGPYYPYQDFTIVMPGYIARTYSSRPNLFFDNQYVATTGLITSFEGNPEMVVKRDHQVNVY